MHNIRGLRAIALYRVSTDKQALLSDKDEKDIPAQKELVHKFVEHSGLNLIEEFVEGGVSGFKVKVEDRDALVAIKKMAKSKDFDVLVVYKSDRIGRTTDESPLVVQYLNKCGIRIFCTDGTELKSDTQIDKLMTWITFWQNETESVKISERSTDYKIISVQNGKYFGGGEKYLPYGYSIIKDGDVNLKGKKIGKIVVDPEEAEIVKLIYKLSIDNNMGNRAIAAYLNEHEEYRSKSKNKTGWNYTSIGYILKNKIYKGYLTMFSYAKNKEYSSPQQKDLIIIQEPIWDK